MHRKFIAVLILGSSILAGGWFTLTHPSDKHSATPDSRPSVAAKSNRDSSLRTSQQGLLEGVAEARDTQETTDLPAIDCQTPQGDVLRVQDTTISAESFCAQMEVLTGPTPDSPTEAWHQQARQLREKWVDAELVRAALAEEGISLDDDTIDEALMQVRQTKTQGATSAFLRAQVRAKLEWNRLLDLRAATKITEENLRAAYARDPERYGEPARATIAPFVIRLSPSASDDEIEEAHKRATQFQKEVTRGDAAAMAKHMGLASLPIADVDEGSLESALAEAAVQLSVGQWSLPVRTKIGWVVAQVQKVRPATTLPFDEVRENVKARLLGQQRHDAEVSLRHELRDGARIDDLVQF